MQFWRIVEASVSVVLCFHRFTLTPWKHENVFHNGTYITTEKESQVKPKDTITIKKRLFCIHMACGYTVTEACAVVGIKVDEGYRLHKCDYIQELISKHIAKIEQGMINAYILSAYSDMTHAGRVVKFAPPQNLSSKEVHKIKRTGLAAYMKGVEKYRLQAEQELAKERKKNSA